MKVTKQYLEQIIKEELESVVQESQLEEGFFDRVGAGVASGWQGLKGAAKSAAVGGIGKAAGMVGAKDVAASAEKTKKTIGMQTHSKQRAVKLQQVILPKINDLHKDMQIVFKGEESKPFYAKVMSAMTDLDKLVHDQMVGSGAAGKMKKEKPVPAEASPEAAETQQGKEEGTE